MIKTRNESSKSIKVNVEINTNILKIPYCGKDNNMERKYNQPSSNMNELRRVVFSRKHFTTMYQSFFFGYCFSCKHFGQKEINCRSYGRNDHFRNGRKIFYQSISFHGRANRDYKYFSPIHYNVECYKCHNYGHIEKYYKNNFRNSEKVNTQVKHEDKRTKVWRKKP